MLWRILIFIVAGWFRMVVALFAPVRRCFKTTRVLYFISPPHGSRFSRWAGACFTACSTW